MPGGRGVARTALLIVVMVYIVHLRYAVGLKEAMRAVPKLPPGSGSSCEMIVMGM